MRKDMTQQHAAFRKLAIAILSMCTPTVAWQMGSRRHPILQRRACLSTCPPRLLGDPEWGRPALQIELECRCRLLFGGPGSVQLGKHVYN